MSIRYICPKCGGTVWTELLLCYPPILRYKCTVCDYLHDEKEVEEKIVAPPEEQQAEALVGDAAGTIVWKTKAEKELTK